MWSTHLSWPPGGNGAATTATCKQTPTLARLVVRVRGAQGAGRADGASGRGACSAPRMCAVRLDEPACTLCVHTCSSSERCSRAQGAGGTRCGHARTWCNTSQHVATCNGLRADPTTSRLSGRRGRTAPPVALASRALSVRSTTTGMPANAAYPIALVASSSAT